MNEELQRLWNLCGFDEQAALLKTALERHPEAKREVESHLAEERAALERNRSGATASQKERRDLERQTEALSAEEKKFQAQLSSVKKNDEYQALLHEIENVQGKRSELETLMLEHLEIEERLEAERPALEGALGRAETTVRERIAQVAVLESAESKQLAEIDARRAVEIAALSPASRSRYERIHASRQGRAVVAIDKNACGGCYRALPPQIMQEAKKRDRLLTCEGCGRIVIYPPNAF